MYSFVFVLGEAYIMMLASWFHWPKEMLFSVIGVWGVSVAFVAWQLYRRKKRNSSSGSGLG
jgi:hypothetical protein